MQSPLVTTELIICSITFPQSQDSNLESFCQQLWACLLSVWSFRGDKGLMSRSATWSKAGICWTTRLGEKKMASFMCLVLACKTQLYERKGKHDDINSVLLPYRNSSGWDRNVLKTWILEFAVRFSHESWYWAVSLIIGVDSSEEAMVLDKKWALWYHNRI